MSAQAPAVPAKSAPAGEIIYPESDGKPIADNTKQFRWIMTIEGGLQREEERRRAEQERQRAADEHQRAEQERQRAEQERQRAADEHQRAERLAARLRALGIDPADV